MKNKNITKQTYHMRGPVAQNGLRHRPAEPKIVGSSPTGPANLQVDFVEQCLPKTEHEASEKLRLRSGIC